MKEKHLHSPITLLFFLIPIDIPSLPADLADHHQYFFEGLIGKPSLALFASNLLHFSASNPFKEEDGPGSTEMRVFPTR